MAHERFSTIGKEDDDTEIAFIETGKYLRITVWDWDQHKDATIELDLEGCDHILEHLPALTDKIRAYTKKLESE